MSHGGGITVQPWTQERGWEGRESGARSADSGFPFPGTGFQNSEDSGRHPSVPPVVPAHFNTGARGLALVADEVGGARHFSPDADDSGCVSLVGGWGGAKPSASLVREQIAVLAPAVPLRARAVAALAGKSWEGGGTVLAAPG